MLEFDEAQQLQSLVIRSAMAITMGEAFKPLPDVPLSRLLIANEVMERENQLAGNRPYPRKMFVTVDPRMTALLYAFQHWGGTLADLAEALGFRWDANTIAVCHGCRMVTAQRGMREWKDYVVCEGCFDELSLQDSENVVVAQL
jgi:hypothetical protein